MDVVSMVMIFPSILHRIESVLITLDACRLLDLPIEPRLALEAMTKDSDNTDDDQAEQINFQTGMGKNYERLEFLGDTFLKMATTISIFTLNPDQTEFTYHVERMVLLCNRNLFNHAVDRDLQQYIRCQAFDRRSWYPNLKLLKGKAAQNEIRNNLADKTIADVCEALIGAAYLTTEGDMDMAVKAVTKMVKSKNHDMVKFEDYYKKFKVPDWHFPQKISQSLLQEVEAVEKSIGYRFKSPTLFFSATKHGSLHTTNDIPNYQQLEFLGDALLDMVFVDFLYKKFPDADPQRLTEYKMAMVSNAFLGFLCVRLGLHTYLKHFHAQLLNQITGYTMELQNAIEAGAQGESKGPDGRIDYWLDVTAAPKALPDIVEAIVGAMFVDSGYNYDVVRTFAETRILPYFKDMNRYSQFGHRHPVTVLGHRLHDLGCKDWRFFCSNAPCSPDEGVKAIMESEVLCGLMIHQKIVANGTGLNSRTAKSAVAKKVRPMLADLEPEQFRERFGCKCVRKTVQPANGG
jgi:endoribonuclease Dicer